MNFGKIELVDLVTRCGSNDGEPLVAALVRIGNTLFGIQIKADDEYRDYKPLHKMLPIVVQDDYDVHTAYSTDENKFRRDRGALIEYLTDVLNHIPKSETSEGSNQVHFTNIEVTNEISFLRELDRPQHISYH